MLLKAAEDMADPPKILQRLLAHTLAISSSREVDVDSAEFVGSVVCCT